MSGRATITVKEMAKRLGIGVNTAYALANSEDFYPAFRIGRKQLINIEKLEEWVDEQSRFGNADRSSGRKSEATIESDRYRIKQKRVQSNSRRIKMKYIQDEIKETIELVKQNLNPAIPEGDHEYIIRKVEKLGYQWQLANAHARVMCISVAAGKHLDGEEFDPQNKEQVAKLESEGSEEIIRVFGLQHYSALVTHFVNEALSAGEAE